MTKGGRKSLDDREADAIDDAAHADTIMFDDLRAGDVITAVTRNNEYRIEVVDVAAARVRVTGGKFFPEPTETTFHGSGGPYGRGVFAGRIMLGYHLTFSHPVQPWNDVKLSRLRTVFLNGTRVLPLQDKLQQ
ncbi:hypothetical protein HY633_03825 [Candidatus Uhrbacteria bacterium]|nr:hypothetical protein [Candidatus Uhrbacteria bacterium]